MYRLCPECNNGKGLRLAPGEVTCAQDHEDILCLLEVGDPVGDFQVEAILPSGEGGFATVYRARPIPQPRLSVYPGSLALKVASTGRRLSLEREAANLAELTAQGCGHIPKVYAVAPPYQAPSRSGMPGVTNPFIGRVVVDLEPFYYMAMEYLPGGSLRDELDRKRGRALGVESAMQIARQVGDALEQTHRAGLIHLDVKPSNIMFSSTGEAVLIDYGIALRLDGEETSWAGTAPYAPREQIDQDYPDERADVHALGVTVFEMLTGRLPYLGGSATALATALRGARPLKIGKVQPKLQYLDEVMARAIDPEVDSRYRTVGEFLAALERALAPRHRKGILSRIVKVVGAFAMAVALLALAPFALNSVMGATGESGETMQTPTAVVDGPTRVTSVAPGLSTPMPGRDGSLLGPVRLAAPPEGAKFNWPEDRGHIVLEWSDPSSPLSPSASYAVNVLLPNGRLFTAFVTTTEYLLPEDLYSTPDSIEGVYRWRVYKAKSVNAEQVSSYSGWSSFEWVSPVISSTPVVTNVPTVEQAMTSLPAVPTVITTPSRTATSPATRAPTNTLPTRMPTFLAPTSTHVPPKPTGTPTAIPEPTDTQIPTETLTAVPPTNTTEATETPEPTDTPQPTDTAVPTSTPLRTDTPLPTDTTVSTPRSGSRPTKTPTPIPPAATRQPTHTHIAPTSTRVPGPVPTKGSG